MSIVGVIKKLPDYADDIKQNLLVIFEKNEVALNQKQLCGVSLAMGYALRHEQLLNGVRAEAKLYLEDIDAHACKVAATIMAMTNIYYRFTSMAPEYRSMESMLSMQSLKEIDVPQEEMDLYCFGVSIINGCEHCVQVHEKRLISAGFSKEAIRDVARIGAVLKAAVNALEIERMRSYDFVVRDASMD